MKTYSIRRMQRAEVDLAVDWAAAEGWNPGLSDAESFYAADPDGFLIGCLDQEPVAVISAIRYGPSFGFMGFYIVKAEHRGKGYGLQIWKAALDHLSGRNIGLDGVLEQQSNYQKAGFRLAYRNIRHEGISGGPAPQDVGLVDVSTVPFEHIEAYDRQFFPEERTRFLSAWLQQAGSIGRGILHAGRLSGYAVLRPCRSGYKIGPLFADTPEGADVLFRSLRSSVPPGEPLYLDTPEINPDALRLAERYEMERVFETARMYTGPFPKMNPHRYFGVTSFELG